MTPSKPFFLHPTRRAFLLGSVAALAACQSEAPDVPDAPAAPEIDTAADAWFRIDPVAGAPRVTSQMLGGNILYHFDDPAGTFEDRIVEMGLRSIRWPGGAVTEWHEDLYDRYWRDAHSRSLSPADDPSVCSLEKTMQLCARRGLELTITLPTIRYVPRPGEVHWQRAQDEIGAFVRAVTNGAYGNIRVQAWEIGNEFQIADNIERPEDYVLVCKKIAQAIRDNAAYHADIGLEGGSFDGAARNIVARELSGSSMDLFDFIIMHNYPWHFDDPSSRATYDDMVAKYPSKYLYLSEWNVHSTQDEPASSIDWGMEAAATIMQIFDEGLRHNVRRAAFWPVQQSTRTTAWDFEGRNPGKAPYIPAATFRWLADLHGLRQLDRTRLAGSGVEVFCYGSDNEIHLLVAGRNSREQTVTLDLPFAPASALGARMFGEVDVWRQIPSFEPLDPALSGRSVTVTVNTHGAHELLRVVLTR